jgi:hypothetical protein
VAGFCDTCWEILQQQEQHPGTPDSPSLQEEE